MENKDRYRLVFGDKPLTLTTGKGNPLMGEAERVAKEKYNAIKEKLPQADNETIAILMVTSSLSVQLSREVKVEKMRKELTALRSEAVVDIKGKAGKSGSDEG